MSCLCKGRGAPVARKCADGDWCRSGMPECLSTSAVAFTVYMGRVATWLRVLAFLIVWDMRCSVIVV